jgi:antitoxin YefM
VKETSYTEARANLAALCDEASNDHEVIIIHRRGARDVALVDAAELQSLTETAYLLRVPANARRILKAIDGLHAGKGKRMSPAELRSELLKQLGDD